MCSILALARAINDTAMRSGDGAWRGSDAVYIYYATKYVSRWQNRGRGPCLRPSAAARAWRPDGAGRSGAQAAGTGPSAIAISAGVSASRTGLSASAATPARNSRRRARLSGSAGRSSRITR
jgi:hypothetical protein